MDSLMDSLIAGKYLTVPIHVLSKRCMLAPYLMLEKTRGEDVLAVAGRGERGRRKKSRRRMDE